MYHTTDKENVVTMTTRKMIRKDSKPLHPINNRINYYRTQEVECYHIEITTNFGIFTSIKRI